MTLQGTYPSKLEIRKMENAIDPQMNCKSRAPLIKVIDNKYMVVATRDEFKLFLYSYDHSHQKHQSKKRLSSNFPKKQFYQTFMISSKDIQFPEKDPGFHCLEHMHTKEGKRYLVFGGNHNVRRGGI